MNLLTYPWIEKRVNEGTLSLHGGYYNFIDCTFEKWKLVYRQGLEGGSKYAIKNRTTWSWSRGIAYLGKFHSAPCSLAWFCFATVLSIFIALCSIVVLTFCKNESQYQVTVTVLLVPLINITLDGHTWSCCMLSASQRYMWHFNSYLIQWLGCSWAKPQWSEVQQKWTLWQQSESLSNCRGQSEFCPNIPVLFSA